MKSDNLNEALPLVGILSKGVATALRSPAGKAIAKEIFKVVFSKVGEKIMNLMSDSNAPKMQEMLDSIANDDNLIDDASDVITDIIADNADKIISEGLKRDKKNLFFENQTLNPRQREILEEAFKEKN